MPTSPVPDPGVASMKKAPALLALLLVVAATLAVYLPTPGNYWIRYDNEALIRNSPQVNALAGADKVAALATMFSSTHYSLYQPLFTLSVAVDHALFGWNIAGFHAHSVLLHVVVVALLLFVLFQLTGSWLAATAATLLVAVHPALVETVRWAICRNSQVAAVWLLIGALLYLRYLDHPARRTRRARRARRHSGARSSPSVFRCWARSLPRWWRFHSRSTCGATGDSTAGRCSRRCRSSWSVSSWRS